MGKSIPLESITNLWSGRIKSNLTKALEKTPDDKLNWAPAPNMIELGKIFLHIAECSDWWYDDIMKGKPGAELAFADQPCLPKEQIAKHMREHWERLKRFWAETDENLAKTYERTGENWHIKQTGCEILIHLLEHDIHHRSQIHQYLRILNIEPPKL